MNRRGFITGLISLVAAPAIVRCGSLMPVRGEPVSMRLIAGYVPGDEIELDVVYGSLRLGDTITISAVRKEAIRQFMVTEIRNSAVNPLGLVPAST